MVAIDAWAWAGEDTYLDALRRRVVQHPDHCFAEFAGSTLSYRQLDDISDRVASGLIARGLSQGGRVASLLNNSLDAIVCCVAVNKAGGIHVPLDPTTEEAPLAQTLANCEPTIVIVEGSGLRTLALALAHCDPRWVVVRSAQGDDDTFKPNDLAIPTVPFAMLANSALANLESPRPSDVACVVYTSGTTGAPKGCTISHNYLCSLSRLLALRMLRVAGDVVWTPQPLFHIEAISSIIVQTVLLGGSASFAGRPSVNSFWSDIRRSGATLVNLLYRPDFAAEIADTPDDDDSLACRGRVGCLRSPVSTPVAEAWRSRFGVLDVGAGNVGYGSTEALLIAMTPPGDPGRPGSSGRVCPLFEVRIVDEQDRALGPDEVGEIVCRPTIPHVMFEGYWNRPDLTLQTMRNLWYHCGDLGRLDADGYLFYVDRKSTVEQAHRRGLSTIDIESLLLEHPDIREAAVHPVASEQGALKATIVLRSGTASSPSSILEWVAARSPDVVDFVEVRDSLPKNPIGKVLKNVLSAEGVTASTWRATTLDVSPEPTSVGEDR